jgi:ABC-type multidrug transport system fused ATPase/permease subunit
LIINVLQGTYKVLFMSLNPSVWSVGSKNNISKPLNKNRVVKTQSELVDHQKPYELKTYAVEPSSRRILFKSLTECLYNYASFMAACLVFNALHDRTGLFQHLPLVQMCIVSAVVCAVFASSRLILTAAGLYTPIVTIISPNHNQPNGGGDDISKPTIPSGNKQSGNHSNSHRELVGKVTFPFDNRKISKQFLHWGLCVVSFWLIGQLAFHYQAFSFRNVTVMSLAYCVFLFCVMIIAGLFLIAGRGIWEKSASGIKAKEEQDTLKKTLRLQHPYFTERGTQSNMLIKKETVETVQDTSQKVLDTDEKILDRACQYSFMRMFNSFNPQMKDGREFDKTGWTRAPRGK